MFLFNLLLTATLLFSNGFDQRVANRCKGEASFALAGCACVVKNRLAMGWGERYVLSAFYAPDRWATESEVATVADVLAGKTYCNPSYYFMFGLGDVYYLGLHNTPPVGKDISGRSQIWYYEYWYKYRRQ